MVCKNQDPDSLLVPCGHVACYTCIEFQEVINWNLLDSLAHDMEEPERAMRVELRPFCPVCHEPFDRKLFIN